MNLRNKLSELRYKIPGSKSIDQVCKHAINTGEKEISLFEKSNLIDYQSGLNSFTYFFAEVGEEKPVKLSGYPVFFTFLHDNFYQTRPKIIEKIKSYGLKVKQFY